MTITKEEFIQGIAKTEIITINNYDFVIRKLSDMEISTYRSKISKSIVADMDIEKNKMFAKNVNVGQIAIDQKEAEFYKIATSITNDNWNITDVKKLDTIVIEKLSKAIDTLSNITDTQKIEQEVKSFR